MTALGALWYGDRHRFINTVQTLRRRPGRLVMWGLYAAATVAFAVFKTGPWSRRSSGVPPFFAVVFADFWVCVLAIAFGIVLATGTARALGVFSSRAEALLLTRAHAAPVVVAGYLQVRAIAAVLVQGLVRFAYVIVVALPPGTTPLKLLALLAFFGAGGAAVASVALPTALARGTTRVALLVAGSAVAVLSALPLVIDGLRIVRFPGSAALLRRVPEFHPGVVLSALAAGDFRLLALPLAIAACATAAFMLAARDAYPELYTISLANIEWHERVCSRRDARGARGAADAPRRKTAPSTTHSRLRGALAFVWIDAIMFGRRVAPPVAALVAALALAGGAVLGAFVRADNADVVFSILFSSAPILYIAIASTTGIRLAPALRLPLFWLGDVPLAARLAAWTFGPFWRDALVVALAVAGFITVSRIAAVPLAVFVAILGLLMLTRTIGLAVFALLPHALDQRGPAVMIRVFLSFALLMPTVVAGAFAAFLSGSPVLAATIAATATALVESALLVMFAAWRLAGRVDSLALA